MENWDPSKGFALVILFGGRPPWRLGDTIRNLVPRHLRISRSLVRGTHPYPYIAPSPDVSGKYHAYLFLGKHISGDKQGGQIWYQKYVWRRRFWGSHSKTQHSNIYLCLEFAEVCQKSENLWQIVHTSPYIFECMCFLFSTAAVEVMAQTDVINECQILWI